MDLTKEFLWSILHYDPESGHLTWKRRPSESFPLGSKVAARWNSRYAGKAAGGVRSKTSLPYVKLSINNKDYEAHRIVWVMMTGGPPSWGDRPHRQERRQQQVAQSKGRL